jgi:hypothetical protein
MDAVDAAVCRVADRGISMRYATPEPSQLAGGNILSEAAGNRIT